jgi:hypothetical protein
MLQIYEILVGKVLVGEGRLFFRDILKNQTASLATHQKTISLKLKVNSSVA